MTAEEESGSEVARLMQQITLEEEAARMALHGPAIGTAKHRFIAARENAISEYTDELVAHVGEEEAFKFVTSIVGRKGGPLPIFLQVGSTHVAFAHIVAVSELSNGRVHVHMTNGYEPFEFEGEEATRFMDLFRVHCQIVSKVQ